MACTGDPAAGAFGKFLIEPGAGPHAFDSDSERYDILLPESLQKHGRLIGGQGTWGGYYPLSTRTRTGHYFVYGEVSFHASPGYFSTLLPYLVGSYNGTNAKYYPNLCPNKFGCLVYRDLEDGTTKSFEYTTCEVAYWDLSASAPQFRQGEGVDENAPDPMRLTVGIIARDEAFTAWPATEPSLPETAAYYPLALFDTATDAGGTFTLNGAARSIFGFRLRYENNRVPWYGNSLAAIGFAPTKVGRRIFLEVDMPWTAGNKDLYDMLYTGAPAVINAVNGSYGTKFTIANLKVPPESPVIVAAGPVGFRIRGQVFGLASNQATSQEFEVENDITA
jgi:hypothetical protein